MGFKVGVSGVMKVLLEDDLTDEHMQCIEACQDDEAALFEFFSQRLQVRMG